MTAWNAAWKLAPILLDKAVVELLRTPSSSSENYISRLEKLANFNTTVVCRLRQGSYDPRLCLLRLYCLKKDHTSAFIQAQARLCSVFDKWPEATDDNPFRLRFSNLALTLNVLDKDIDAIATWQATKPYQPLNALVADSNIPSTGELTKPSFEVPQTNAVPVSSGKQSGDGPDVSSSATITTNMYATGYYCIGGCRKRWEIVLSDCYVCKHFLCVHFCSRCYTKLRVDEIHHVTCNEDHKMLFISSFDWEAWRTYASGHDDCGQAASSSPGMDR